MVQASEEIQNLVIEMRERGCTYKEMMEASKLSKNTIIKIFKEHNISLPGTERTKTPRICKNCGKEYIFDKSINPEATKLFCSTECSKEYRINKPYSGKKEYIEISDFYKEKGYTRLYIATNKENRKVATIRKPDGETHSMAYAKYVYTSHHHYDVPEGDQVDHINGDKTDDRIENLQVISKNYNIRKDHIIKEMVECECPICHKRFLLNKRDFKYKNNPCCSLECGNKKKSETVKEYYKNKKLLELNN